MSAPKPRRAKGYRALKHALDLGMATALFVPMLPVLGALCLLVRLESCGPAIYRQKRVGRFGRTFTILKLRSMKTDTPTLSTQEMQRAGISPFTRLGPLLRKSNLDELPQIWNILRGEMSFVGPRPALPTQTDVNDLRREMGVEMSRPGITGLAQVKGRDDLETPVKVAFDAKYCRELNLWLDLWILLQTIGAVVSARGNK